MGVCAALLRGLLLNLYVEQFIADALKPAEGDTAACHFVAGLVLPVFSELDHFARVAGSVYVGNVVAGGVKCSLGCIESLHTNQQRCIQSTHSRYIWQDQV